jgi:hypothetical protein
MAGQTKPPGQRVRRNIAEQWRKLDGEGREAPPLNRLPGRRRWLEQTRDWWADLWASPMALAYLVADEGGLQRLAKLKDKENRGELGATEMVAMLSLEDRYGLNPKARRALQWEVSQGGGFGDPKEPPTPEPGTSNVYRIRAQDSDAVAGA